MHIPLNAQRILKVLHLLAVSFWVGGCLAMMTLFGGSQYAQSSEELRGMLLGGRVINMALVYCGAFGSFFTGLAYSLCTSRGFFQHKWVLGKWLITLLCIGLGFSCFAPWSTRMIELVQELGIDALHNAEYQRVRLLHIRLQALEMGLFILAFVLSIYLPWEQAELRARGRGSLAPGKHLG